jgi:hypothetical protein
MKETTRKPTTVCSIVLVFYIIGLMCLDTLLHVYTLESPTGESP